MLCTDCLKNEATMSCKKINDGLCKSCRRRKGVMGFNYIPIKDIKEEKLKRSVEIEKIKKEVEDNLEACYNEHNCNMKSEIHIDDIMVMLVTLRNLFSNKELITEMKNKLDIIEKYRIDINHEDEIEKVLTDDELAIYISRKENILNGIRREIKDKVDLYEIVEHLMRQIKSNNHINLDLIDSIITKFTDKIKLQESDKRQYTPYVDHSMSEKYEWCKPIGTKYVTKKKPVDYKVTASKTNLNKKIFNEPVEIIVNKCYSEDEAIMHAKRKLGLDRPLKISHNIFSNFKAERCNSEN